jgi:hypothetical protein
MTVLDTNVISELMRARPAEAVLAWVNGRPAAGLYITAITQAEILLGVQLVPKGKRREALVAAAGEMFARDFAGRILAFGSSAAAEYAAIVAARRRVGRPISTFDAQIAAIARAAGGELATRNVADFDDCGIDVVDPWR